jgi:hypothetical protein
MDIASGLSAAPFHTNPSDGAEEAPAALDRARVVVPRVGFATVTGTARRRPSRTETVFTAARASASPPNARATTTAPTRVREPPAFDGATVFPFPRVVFIVGVFIAVFAVTGVARIIIVITIVDRVVCARLSRVTRLV